MAAFTLRGAGCCIHTHSKDAVLVTLLCEAAGTDVFEIQKLEQIKGIPKGYGEEKKGNLGYHDRLRIPIIDNTAHEEDLKDTLEGAIKQWPDTHAVLVKRHGMYVLFCRVPATEKKMLTLYQLRLGQGRRSGKDSV
jgi:methylthioribulose-1-phosphate dehydratase